MTEHSTDVAPLLTDYQFEQLSKSGMISYLDEIGVEPGSFTTKVTKRELRGFYSRFKELPLAISLVPPTEDGLHMDLKYRRELLEKANQLDLGRWQHNGGNVKHSHALTYFIFETRRKLVAVEKSKDQATESVDSPSISREEYEATIKPESITTAVIATKEPEDDIVRAFKYLGDLSSKSNAEITVVFKPTF